MSIKRFVAGEKASLEGKPTYVAMSVLEYLVGRDKIPDCSEVVILNSTLRQAAFEDSESPEVIYEVSDVSDSFRLGWPLEIRDIPESGFTQEMQVSASFQAPELYIRHESKSEDCKIIQILPKGFSLGLVEFIQLL